MNFFGHATVACWQRREPAFVLGAMLPDFASMSRTRVAAVEHPEAAAGVALHHRTDAAFHRCEAFRVLYRDGVEALRARGLARGAAWGAAHVGIELALDGALVDDRDVGAVYVDALEAARHVPIRWRDERGAARWQRIHERLAERGVPHDYRDPEIVAQRVGLVLSHRPNLALADGEQAIVARWLRDAAPSIAAAAPMMLDDVRAALG